MHLRHKRVNIAILKLANPIVGLTLEREPATSGVLLNVFTAQECRKLFPKRSNKKRREAAVELFRRLGELRKLEPNSLQFKNLVEELRASVDQLPDLDEKIEDRFKTGRRLDAQITTSAGETVWLDATIIHSSSKSKAAAELKRNIDSAKLDFLSRPGSRALEDAEQRKRDHYQPMLNIARMQKLANKRTHEPKFFAVAISTFGELSEDTLKLQEWLVFQYKTHVAEQGPRDDGRTCAELTAQFRQRFRHSLYIEVAKGTAHMIRAAGQMYG